MLKFIQFILEELPEYLYHATHEYNANDIKDSKKLMPHSPSYGTDQSSWPDGKREKRSYFSHSEDIAKDFHTEGGKPTMLRIKTASHPHFQKERYTNDYYTNKHIPSKHFEVKGQNGEWKNLHE